ncbi:hypothetical protein K502DRAFT_352031 [Neoconidiobolus thromboides FSU 785]|nr:hypothetical protein K502DRAFT_352031 [Neoconidiobolus thromboides FSU 785]
MEEKSVANKNSTTCFDSNTMSQEYNYSFDTTLFEASPYQNINAHGNSHFFQNGFSFNNSIGYQDIGLSEVPSFPQSRDELMSISHPFNKITYGEGSSNENHLNNMESENSTTTFREQNNPNTDYIIQQQQFKLLSQTWNPSNGQNHVGYSNQIERGVFNLGGNYNEMVNQTNLFNQDESFFKEGHPNLSMDLDHKLPNSYDLSLNSNSHPPPSTPTAPFLMQRSIHSANAIYQDSTANNLFSPTGISSNGNISHNRLFQPETPHLLKDIKTISLPEVPRIKKKIAPRIKTKKSLKQKNDEQTIIKNDKETEDKNSSSTSDAKNETSNVDLANSNPFILSTNLTSHDTEPDLKQDDHNDSSEQTKILKQETITRRRNKRERKVSERKLLPLLPNKSIYPNSLETHNERLTPGMNEISINSSNTPFTPIIINNSTNFMNQLATKSNYQLLLEGKNKDFGLDFGPQASLQIEKKRKAHKDSERLRRQALNDQFNVLRNTLTGMTEKDSKYSVLLHAKESIISNQQQINEQNKQLFAIIKKYMKEVDLEEIEELNSEEKLNNIINLLNLSSSPPS